MEKHLQEEMLQMRFRNKVTKFGKIILCDIVGICG